MSSEEFKVIIIVIYIFFDYELPIEECDIVFLAKPKMITIVNSINIQELQAIYKKVEEIVWDGNN